MFNPSISSKVLSRDRSTCAFWWLNIFWVKSYDALKRPKKHDHTTAIVVPTPASNWRTPCTLEHGSASQQRCQYTDEHWNRKRITGKKRVQNDAWMSCIYRGFLDVGFVSNGRCYQTGLSEHQKNSFQFQHFEMQPDLGNNSRYPGIPGYWKFIEDLAQCKTVHSRTETRLKKLKIE